MDNYSKCNLIKEKLLFLINFFFDENNMNDENIFKLGLSILKYFFINNQYEIIFVKNINSLNNIDLNNKNSILIIDYLNEATSSNDNNYSPYIVLQQVKLFKSININIENSLNKSYLLESILEFYYLCFSKNFLFLKNVNLNPLFKAIFEEKELMKISSTKRITSYLLRILNYLPFQLKENTIFNSSKIDVKNKNNSIQSDEIRLIIDTKHKISIINFLINFWKNLNVIISKSAS